MTRERGSLSESAQEPGNNGDSGCLPWRFCSRVWLTALREGGRDCAHLGGGCKLTAIFHCCPFQTTRHLVAHEGFRTTLQWATRTTPSPLSPRTQPPPSYSLDDWLGGMQGAWKSSLRIGWMPGPSALCHWSASPVLDQSRSSACNPFRDAKGKRE